MTCPKILKRYSKPGQYDMVPKGTICRVIEGELGREEIYIQTSEDDNEPLWELQDGNNLLSLRLAITACEGLTDPR